MAAVEIHQLSKSFGKTDVLSSLDLAFPAHRRTVVLGRSGSGKTTLLRLIAGLEEPTSGSVSIDGRSMTRVAPFQRHVAMTFQHDALLPHRTIRDNVEFPLLMSKQPRHEAKRRAAELLSLMRLDALADRFPDSLSGGQRQLAALARALVRRPHVVLMDEPFAHLDAPLRREIRQRVIEIQEQLQATMVLVTHDQREALELADHLVILHDRQIAFSGLPESAYREPPTLAVAGFLGDPPVNTIDLNTAPEWGAVMDPPATAAMAGFRPEHVRLLGSDLPASSSTSSCSCACTFLRSAFQGADAVWEAEAAGIVVTGVGVVPAAMHKGAAATLSIERSDLHWFDAAGRRIAT